MPDSVYRVTQVIGTSSDSWEAAARNAVETAARTVRDLRVAEVEVTLAHRATGTDWRAQVHRARQFADVARALAVRQAVPRKPAGREPEPGHG